MSNSIKQVALRTIELEAKSVTGLTAFIDDDFEKAVKTIADNKGRLVVSGIGKSAATLPVLRLFLCMRQMLFMEIWAWC